MSDLLLDLAPDLWRRLEAMATKMGHSMEDCARLGLVEFLDNWEDHLRVMAALENEDERPQLGSILD